MSIISTNNSFKGIDTKYARNDNTKIVKTNNHTSGKNVNKTSLSSYSMQIPRQKNKNEAMVVIKIASVRHRARIKDGMTKLGFEDKAFPRERQCYNNKIVLNR